MECFQTKGEFPFLNCIIKQPTYALKHVFSRLPVIDVTYFVGLNRSNVPASFDVSKITLRLPDIPTLAGQLSSKNLQLCDCDIFEGYLLHLVGIVSFMPNISSYNSALQTAWITTAPELICPSCVVDIQFARTVITIGATGSVCTLHIYYITSCVAIKGINCCGNLLKRSFVQNFQSSFNDSSLRCITQRARLACIIRKTTSSVSCGKHFGLATFTGSCLSRK
jgi:hypothetical protein